MNLDPCAQAIRSDSERIAQATPTLEPACAAEHRQGDTAAADTVFDLPGF